MPDQTFIIPSAFRPARSLLGRWIRTRSIDDRQAESTYIVVAVVSVLALLLIHLLGWSFFRPLDSGATIAFVVAEAIFVLAFAGAAFAGRDSAITVRIETTALSISRSDGDELRVPYEDVDGVSRVKARTFHRHYSRYAETRAFVNRVHDELLLLRWKGTPVVLGLPEDDLRSVDRILNSRVAVGRASSHVDAA